MADIVPGVSGGTMALITGIYERLVHAIRTLNLRWLTRRLRGDVEGSREAWGSIDIALLVPLLLGILTAVLIMSQVISYFLSEHLAPTMAFFFGLILASAVLVSRYVDRVDWRHLLSGSVGFVIVFVVVGLDEVMSNHSLPVIFVSGAIAICAMILPGISGALILVILGQYNYMIDALKDVVWRDIIAFVLGALVGILAFARLLDWVLNRARSVTMAFLFGCMLGALRRPFTDILSDIDASATDQVAIVVAAACVGFGLVFALERRSERIKERLGIEGD